VLEANHDEDMLAYGPYPSFLKKRIASPLGHLSNRQSAALATAVAGSELEHVILAHLSKENNTRSLAYEAVAPGLEELDSVSVDVAGRMVAGEPVIFRAQPRGAANSPPRAPQPPLFD